MRKIVFLLLLILSSGLARSQSLSPSIISSDGGVSRSSGIMLEWTLGESVIGIASSADRLYTVGFHQPILISRSISLQEISPLYQVQVFPNPVQNVLTVKLQSVYNANVKLILTDLHGRTVQEKTIYAKTSFAEMPVQNLVSGVYQLRVTDKDGNLVNAFKIIKAN